jgi:hypothetical protein
LHICMIISIYSFTSTITPMTPNIQL